MAVRTAWNTSTEEFWSALLAPAWRLSWSRHWVNSYWINYPRRTERLECQKRPRKTEQLSEQDRPAFAGRPPEHLLRRSRVDEPDAASVGVQGGGVLRGGHRSWLETPRAGTSPNWGHLEGTWRREREERMPLESQWPQVGGGGAPSPTRDVTEGPQAGSPTEATSFPVSSLATQW